MILTTIEVPEDYWESTSTNNEEFEFIYNEKELSDIYIWFQNMTQITLDGRLREFHFIG